MVTSSTNDTKAALSRHLEAAVSKNLDAILEDYGDESVIYTPDGPIRGWMRFVLSLRSSWLM
jgi:hypothetical protein